MLMKNRAGVMRATATDTGTMIHNTERVEYAGISHPPPYTCAVLVRTHNDKSAKEECEKSLNSFHAARTYRWNVWR